MRQSSWSAAISRQVGLRLREQAVTRSALASRTGIAGSTLNRRLATGCGWTIAEVERCATALGVGPGDLLWAAVSDIDGLGVAQ